MSIKRDAHGQEASFEWRELQAADGTAPGGKALTAGSISPRTTKYFGVSRVSFMVD